MESVAKTGDSTETQFKDIEELFRKYWYKLYATALRFTKNEDDAEEVLQTILVRLMNGPLPDGLKENPEGYLYRAARNEAFHFYHKQQRRKEDPYPEEEPEDSEDGEPVGRLQLEIAMYGKGSPLTRTMRDRLFDATEQLEDEEIKLLDMRYTFGWSETEIAEQLDVPRGTIAARLSRIRTKVKDILEKSDETQ